MKTRTKTLLILIPLAILDALIPLPIVGFLLLYILISRPLWFLKLVREIFQRQRPRPTEGPSGHRKIH